MPAEPLPAIDQNVRIPAGVKAASARADAAFKSAYAPVVIEDAPPPPADDGQPPLTAAPAEPPAPPADAPPPPTDNWEQRYRAMEGRINQMQNMQSRLDRATVDLEAERARTTRLEELLAASVIPANATPQTRDTRASSLLTPEERSEYGEEFLSVAQRAARESLSPEIEAMRSELNTMKSASTEEKRQRTNDFMDRNLPEWRDMNGDPNFIAWLGLQDTFSGVNRQELLKQAYGHFDGPRVLAFFKSYLSEVATVAPAQPAPAPAAPVAPRLDLASLAAPGRAPSPRSNDAREKPIISTAQISAFYAAKAQGKYRGKEDEADKFEAQIFEAQRDGRVR